MDAKTLSTAEDCRDFVRGCTLLGTGGGGSPFKGLAFLLPEIEAGREFHWVDIDSLPDDCWTASCWGMGSVAPRSPLAAEGSAALGLNEEQGRHGFDRAILELSKYTNRKVEAVVPSELGGNNTPGPMWAAMKLGLPVVDGDYTGRAAPEVVHTSPLVLDQPMLPLASVDPWGDVCLIAEARNAMIAERIGKYLGLAVLSNTYMAGFLLQVRDVKKSLVRGTLTAALKLGRAIREARQRALDPVQAAAAAYGGWVLFEGVIEAKDWEDRDGYMYGEYRLAGTGVYASHQARIWLKNEHHILWIDGGVQATTPDLIAVVDLETAEPYTNTKLEAGQRVAILGYPGPELWRTKKGLSLMGPSYFGFDIPYIPLEERMKARGW